MARIRTREGFPALRPVEQVEEMARTRMARRLLRLIGWGALVALLAGALLA